MTKPRRLAVLLLTALTLTCRAAREESVFQGSSMGTTYTVKVVSLAPELEEAVSRTITQALGEVDAKMSTYRADSELSRFNRTRGLEPFPLSAETFEVFRLALETSRLSAGAFDVTVGPLVDAWGFGPGARSPQSPTAEELRRLLSRTGYRHLELDAPAATVRKTVPDLTCDLSAIAKGYGVDRVAEALGGLGVSDYMVEVGGEVRTRGHNAQGGPWRIAVESPLLDQRRVHRVIPLSGWAMATSGDYRNYIERNGVRLSHILDPRTGGPVTHRLAAVTVIHRRCALADALATALLVLGPEAGYELAVQEDLAALFLLHHHAGGFDERTTPAFEEFQ